MLNVGIFYVLCYRESFANELSRNIKQMRYKSTSHTPNKQESCREMSTKCPASNFQGSRIKLTNLQQREDESMKELLTSISKCVNKK